LRTGLVASRSEQDNEQRYWHPTPRCITHDAAQARDDGPSQKERSLSLGNSTAFRHHSPSPLSFEGGGLGGW
ncbi:MAG: hypothetical protein MK135_13745, partial [Polyangiaceae bacterium]|nr:hypothetical protein [Polyangiaceae bacterium]